MRRAATVFLQCSCCLHHSIAADTKPTTAKKTRGRENIRGTGKPFPVIHLPVVPTAGQKSGNVADKIKKSSYSFVMKLPLKICESSYMNAPITVALKGQCHENFVLTETVGF